jgi:hypothetical protein
MFMCVVNRKSVNKLDLTWKQSFLIQLEKKKKSFKKKFLKMDKKRRKKMKKSFPARKLLQMINFRAFDL